MRAVREVRWVQYSQLSRLRSHVCTVDGLFRFPIFLKTLNWRDGTGDNSSGNWSLHEFFSPIFSLGPSRIQRCIVLLEPTKTRISPSGKMDTERVRLRRTGC